MINFNSCFIFNFHLFLIAPKCHHLFYPFDIIILKDTNQAIEIYLYQN